MDWGEFRDEAAAAIVAAVRLAQQENPQERFHAAGLYGIYREQGGVITVPELALNSEAPVADWAAQDEGGWWNPADWDDWRVWLSEDRQEFWSAALTEAAGRGSAERWEATFARYLEALIAAARQARNTLRASGFIDGQFVVLVHDDVHLEAVTRACLTDDEIRQWFPAFEEHAAELVRVAALPPEERIAFYLTRLTSRPGVISREEAEAGLRTAGPSAVPALLGLLEQRKKEFHPAVRLLIDLGQDDPAVIAALEAKLTRSTGPDQLWVARALAALGHLERVLEASPSDEVVVVALAWPLTASRDHQAVVRPIDYGPVEAALGRHPALAGALAEALRPGGGTPDLGASEVEEALRGLTLPAALIRRHAGCLLGNHRLGRYADPLVRERVVAALTRAGEHDEDADVRRLAALALDAWPVPEADRLSPLG